MIAAGRTYSHFYLHGGPGLSAIAERETYQDQEGIYWWDQPRPAPGAMRPFAALIDAAEAEFTRQATANGGQTGLIANSFGAHLTLHLAHRIPEKISGIILLAPVFDPGIGFTGFARRIATTSNHAAPLLSAADGLETSPDDPARFWELVMAIVTAPGFSDHYWSPTNVKQQKWFAALLANPAMFDFSAFQTIVADFFTHPRTESPSKFSGPVSLVFGVHDPLNDPVNASLIWKKYFPQAQVDILDGGHLLHLELPKDAWLK